MNDSIKQIGERLIGLRESLNIPAIELAQLCGISLEHYLKIEKGVADPSVYRLSKIAAHCGVELDSLLFGEDPLMNSYFLTRKGQGLSIDRRKDYKYQSLGSGFRNRKASPFIVQVDPRQDGKDFRKNSHDGQEFDYVLEGELEITIGEKTLKLNSGDSIYFDARQPHCMQALNNKSVKFLCVII